MCAATFEWDKHMEKEFMRCPKDYFETKLLVQWEKDHTGDEDYVNKKIDLFCSFLQEEAANKWYMCAATFEWDKHMEKNFMSS